MMVRRPMVLAALVALVTVGCGGSELSLQEYFSKLHELQAPFAQNARDREAELQSALQGATDKESLSLARADLEDIVAALDNLVADLEAIDPPKEAEQQHAEFVAATGALRDAAAGVIDRFDEFGSFDELLQFFTADLAEVGKRGDDACNALQAVADDNSIDVDLSCQ